MNISTLQPPTRFFSSRSFARLIFPLSFSVEIDRSAVVHVSVAPSVSLLCDSHVFDESQNTRVWVTMLILSLATS